MQPGENLCQTRAAAWAFHDVWLLSWGSRRPQQLTLCHQTCPSASSARAHGSEATLARHATKTQPSSAWGFDVHYQRPFLLLSSPDQRLLLFLLLLLILFSTLIAQSSLTMTLMLIMWRWRGCFNELPSRSEGLRGERGARIGSTEHQNTASAPAPDFHQPWPLKSQSEDLMQKVELCAVK